MGISGSASFPELEKIFTRRLRSCLVTAQGISAGELQMREHTDWITDDQAAMIQNLLNSVANLSSVTRIVANTDWQRSAIAEVDGLVYGLRGVFDGFDFNFNFNFHFPIAHAELVTLNLKSGQRNKVATTIDPNLGLGPIFGGAPVRP